MTAATLDTSDSDRYPGEARPARAPREPIGDA
jgi:hypothetical protein